MSRVRSRWLLRLVVCMLLLGTGFGGGWIMHAWMHYPSRLWISMPSESSRGQDPVIYTPEDFRRLLHEWEQIWFSDDERLEDQQSFEVHGGVI